MSSFEGYKPGKESREIDRAQRESAQKNLDGTMKEVRLGFARSHTETAKPMDTLKGMIKRAYKEGKLYSEKQASEAAGEVVKRLEVAGAKMRVSPGDHITFRNDSIDLRTFDRKEAGFISTRILLGPEVGSLHYREQKIIQEEGKKERKVLAKEIDHRKEPGWQERMEFRKSLTPEELQRLDAFAEFLSNMEGLKSIIRVDEKEVAQLLTVTELKPDEAPTGYPGFVFGRIAALKGEGNIPIDVSLGVNPKEGKVVLYNNLEKKEFARIPWENPSQNIRALKLALALIANPDKSDGKK